MESSLKALGSKIIRGQFESLFAFSLYVVSLGLAAIVFVNIGRLIRGKGTFVIHTWAKHPIEIPRGVKAYALIALMAALSTGILTYLIRAGVKPDVF
jgi:hypothetical protein